MGKIFLGVFRLPFIAYYDYKYNHNAAYREKVIRQDEMQESLEKARLKKLQDALNNFIQEDLAKENP
jgi:predicted transcriptional regulator